MILVTVQLCLHDYKTFFDTVGASKHVPFITNAILLISPSLPESDEWELLDAAKGATASGSSASGDARLLHPAAEAPTCRGDAPTPSMLSPEECFERVEMRFRAMLRKRHVPLGILANLEDDLTGFFR